MEPVTTETRGYRVKEQFKHLLPPVHKRPDNYYLTPYCLPIYDPQYKLAMYDLSLFEYEDCAYFGAFNNTIHTE